MPTSRQPCPKSTCNCYQKHSKLSRLGARGCISINIHPTDSAQQPKLLYTWCTDCPQHTVATNDIIDPPPGTYLASANSANAGTPLTSPKLQHHQRNLDSQLCRKKTLSRAKSIHQHRLGIWFFINFNSSFCAFCPSPTPINPPLPSFSRPLAAAEFRLTNKSPIPSSLIPSPPQAGGP